MEAGALDAELAGLLWLLGERGVPLVLASRHRPAAETVAAALPGVTGTLVADSLEEVARLGGGSAPAGLPDELRDLGVVVVVRRIAGRPLVVAAHYVRPLERDVGGHVQRRGPAVLAAWDEQRQAWEHFAWGVTPELAERGDMPFADFERERERRVSALETPS